MEIRIASATSHTVWLSEVRVLMWLTHRQKNTIGCSPSLSLSLTRTFACTQLVTVCTWSFMEAALEIGEHFVFWGACGFVCHIVIPTMANNYQMTEDATEYRFASYIVSLLTNEIVARITTSSAEP